MKSTILILCLFLSSCYKYNAHPKYKKGDIVYLHPLHEKVIIIDVNINGYDYEYNNGYQILRNYCNEFMIEKK